jgi:hypothetical protein
MGSSTPNDITSDLHRRLTRLESIQEIHNLMGRRAYLHSAGRHDLEISELWSHHPDVVFEAEDMGAWTSLSSIRKSYVDGNPFPPGTKGLMVEHTLTTPVLEIAEDGKTAKGVWISPGHETFPVGEGERPKSHWSWGRYAVDFRKEEDGKWKIWHLHVLTTFRTPYNQDWVETALNKPKYLPEDGKPMESIGVADRGVSFNQPYHPGCDPVLQPVPPEPYKTWDETWSATDLYIHSAE